jgi:hypothetical protein
MELGGLNFIFFTVFLARGCGCSVLWRDFWFRCGFRARAPPQKRLVARALAQGGCALLHACLQARENGPFFGPNQLILINEALSLYNMMCVLQYMMLVKHHMVCIEANKWWIRDE